VLGVLSVWRVTHLLNAEDGPWNLIVRIRQRAGTGFWAGVLDCFYCLSLWIAAPLACVIGSGWLERLLLWPALSAGAILLERLAPERTAAPAFILKIRRITMCCGKNRQQFRMQTHPRPATPVTPGGRPAPLVQPAPSAPRGPNSPPAPVASAGPQSPPKPRLNAGVRYLQRLAAMRNARIATGPSTGPVR